MPVPAHSRPSRPASRRRVHAPQPSRFPAKLSVPPPENSQSPIEAPVSHASAPVPVLLLTGFLGAGKTTLLRHWLERHSGQELGLGVVMNDYGPVSIDSLLISKPDLPLQTIGGGCLCCAAEADLGEAIVAVLAKGPIRSLVVEASGLADPTATIERLVDPVLAHQIRLQGVVTVVDAESTARKTLDRRDARLWRAQIRWADWILLSKCDLLPPEGVARIEAEIAQLNPQATVCRLPQNPPDPQTLLAAGIQQLRVPAKGRRPRNVQHAHQSHQTIGFQFTRAANRAALERFLTRLNPEEVVRAKGFVRLRGHPRQWFVFHYVLGSHSLEPYSGHETPRPVGVFIGPGLDANAYQRRMQRVFDPGSTKSSRPSRPTRRTPARRRGR